MYYDNSFFDYNEEDHDLTIENLCFTLLNSASEFWHEYHEHPTDDYIYCHPNDYIEFIHSVTGVRLSSHLYSQFDPLKLHFSEIWDNLIYFFVTLQEISKEEYYG